VCVLYASSKPTAVAVAPPRTYGAVQNVQYNKFRSVPSFDVDHDYTELFIKPQILSIPLVRPRRSSCFPEIKRQRSFGNTSNLCLEDAALQHADTYEQSL